MIKNCKAPERTIPASLTSILKNVFIKEMRMDESITNDLQTEKLYRMGHFDKLVATQSNSDFGFCF